MTVLEDVLARARQRAVDRQLASNVRAGSWARRQVYKRRRAYIRHAWPLLAFFIGASVGASFVSLLVPGWARGFVIGAVIASGLWGCAMHVAVNSGAASVHMGQVAEEMVSQELQRLRRRGWYLVNHALVGSATSDIDHLLVGPGGVLVISTKYTESGWGTDKYSREQLQRAVTAVKGQSSVVATFSGVPRQLVKPVLVLDSPVPSQEPVKVTEDGVVVLPL